VKSKRGKANIGSQRKPPPVLDCARILYYAAVDRSAEFAGHTGVFVDGNEVGRVPRLAIVEDPNTAEFLLFHCKESWRVVACSGHPTIAAAKKRAKGIYPGLSSHWIKSGVTKKQAEEFLNQLFADRLCHGCNRRPDQVRQILRKGPVRICNLCIDELQRTLRADIQGAD
jgi:hypothetical protein